MSLPKILIATTIYDKKDYCLKEFIDNCKTFTYKNYHHVYIDNSSNLNYVRKLRRMGLKAYHVERGGSTREALARSQNLARKICLEGGYDYMFSLESDIFPKHNIIEALLRHQLNIVTGLYMLGDREKGERIPCITLPKKTEKGTWGSRLIQPDEYLDYINQGIKEVSAGGFGCCLIHKNVLKKIPFMYIPGHKGHSDVFFFWKAEQIGFRVFVDTDLFCEHINTSWDNVEDR